MLKLNVDGNANVECEQALNYIVVLDSDDADDQITSCSQQAL